MSTGQVRLTKTQKVILDKIGEEPKSIQQVADSVGIGYHAARKHVIYLAERRFIEESGILRNRAKVYMLVNQELDDTRAYSNSIPTLYNHIDNLNFKALALLPLVGREQELASVQANMRVPGNVAQLLYIAMLCNKGMDQTEELYALRKEMQRDYVLLNSAMQYVNQILQNPEWWDQKYLKNMPLDKDYHFPDIREAYRAIKGDTIL